MNKTAFFNYLRSSTLFGGKLTQGVVDTCNAIIIEFERRNVCDARKIAYALATAYREAYSASKNPEWNPVREGFKTTDASSIAFVRDVLKKPYWKISANGKSFFGRGWVQLTHETNYKSVGKLIGVDLYNNPEKALERPVSAKILVGGMIGGWFTGVDLGDFINDNKTDFFNARKIINGLDAAREVANTAEVFYKALTTK